MEKLKPCPFCGRIPELTHLTAKTFVPKLKLNGQ